MSQELVDMLDKEQAARTQESQDAELEARYQRASAALRQEEAQGTNEQKPPMSDDEAAAKAEERSNNAYKEYLDNLNGPSPDPNKISELEKAPVATLSREAWNGATGVAKGVVDLPGYVVAGLFDTAHNFADSAVAFDDFVKSYGWVNKHETRPTDPNEPLTMIGGIGKMAQKPLHAMEPWVADHWEKDNPIRMLVNGISAWYGVKKFLVASNLVKTAASVGRGALEGLNLGPRAIATANYVGKVSTNALHAGIAQAVGMAQDANFLNAMQALGFPRGEVIDYLRSDEDNPEFINRVVNGVTAAAAGTLIEPAADALAPAVKYAMGQMRRLYRTAITTSKRAAEVGSPELEAVVREAQAHADHVATELRNILGDPAEPVVRKTVPPPAALAPLTPLKDLGASTDEAMSSILNRMENPSKAPEPLIDLNWSKLGDATDIHRAASDLQDALDAEIGQAVGPVRTHASVAADAAELDAFNIIQKGLSGSTLEDSETVQLRNFYILAIRKFAEIAKLHRNYRSPDGQVVGTEATRAAAGKMLDIIRNTQRIIRRESAQASRRLGAFRIPASTTKGYDLYSQVQDVVTDSLDDKSLDTVLQAVARAADTGDMAKVANVTLGVDGIKLAGQKVAEGIKTLYYFSLLSRLTTQIRNGVGSPAFYMIRMAELKAANVISNVMGDGAVYDGEVMANMAGFMKGIGEAFRMPQMVTAADEGIEAAMNRDALGLTSAAADMGKAFDGGVYKAFLENRSQFGGSSVRDAPGRGPLFGETPTHLLGYSVEENIGRALNLLHASTMRPLRALISVPTRSLNAMDELWKTANYRGEIRMLAYRRAVDELRSGKLAKDSFSSRVEALAADPDMTMQMAGRQAALEGTFTNAPTGPFGKFLESAHRLPYIGPLAVPFTRAPGNINWQVLRRTPLGAIPAVDDFLNDITGTDLRKRDLAWSRYLLGNAAILGVLDFFMDGDRVRIVGDVAPDSPAEAQTRRRNFLDPLTIQISTDPNGGFENGTFVKIPFRGYDPVSGSLLIAANMLQFMENSMMNEHEVSFGEMATATVSALASTLTSQTSLSSMQDMFTALSEGRFGEFVAEQSLAVPTPGMFEQFVPLFDDVYRETFSWMDKIRAQTPGLSNSLPARRNAWGRIMKRLPGWQGVMQSIMPVSVDPNEQIEPVDKWLMDRGFFVGEPSKKRAEFRDGVEIPWYRYPKAYEEYKRLSGNALARPELHQDIIAQMAIGNISHPPAHWRSASGDGLVGDLNMLVQGTHPSRDMQSFFNRLPTDEDRMRFMRQAISFFRDAAREKILEDPQFSDLATEVRLKKHEKAQLEKDPEKRRRLLMGFGTDLRMEQ